MAGQARGKIAVTRVARAARRRPLPGEPPAVAGWLVRLCLALLEDALQALGSSGRRQSEAREWILSEAEYCLSFVWVCAVLQLDADAVRKQFLL